MATSVAARPRNGVTVDVHRDRNALVVRAAGELDMSSTEELKNGLLRAFESSAPLIVLHRGGGHHHRLDWHTARVVGRESFARERGSTPHRLRRRRPAVARADSAGSLVAARLI
jgi:hypothetical protein